MHILFMRHAVKIKLYIDVYVYNVYFVKYFDKNLLLLLDSYVRIMYNLFDKMSI